MSEALSSVADERTVREWHGRVIVRAGNLIAASQQWQADGNLAEVQRVADGLQDLHEGGSVHPWVNSPEEYFSRLVHRLWLAAGKPYQIAKTEAQYRDRFPTPMPWDTHVHRHHTLYLPVEPTVSLTSLCAGFRIAYRGDDKAFESWDERAELSRWQEPHWMWCQPGTWFLNQEPRKVRAEGCADKEWPLSAREGVHIWGLTGPYPWVTDCPRSVRRVSRGYCAYLGLVSHGPSLDGDWDGRALPRCGAGSRGE